MDPSRIIKIQEKIGTKPDGFWGPISERKCREYLRSMMPVMSPWPGPGRVEVAKFYGEPGREQDLVRIDVSGFQVKFGGQPVTSIRCHAKVAESLASIIQQMHIGGHLYELALFAGCYNNRTVRGGSALSLHAWGAAVDFDAAGNGNHVHWPVQANMPLEVMEIFARHGWTSAGAFWGRDAMHFQATKPI
jgi:hypothetical protein